MAFSCATLARCVCGSYRNVGREGGKVSKMIMRLLKPSRPRILLFLFLHCQLFSIIHFHRSSSSSAMAGFLFCAFHACLCFGAVGWHLAVHTLGPDAAKSVSAIAARDFWEAVSSRIAAIQDPEAALERDAASLRPACALNAPLRIREGMLFGNDDARSTLDAFLDDAQKHESSSLGAASLQVQSDAGAEGVAREAILDAFNMAYADDLNSNSNCVQRQVLEIDAYDSAKDRDPLEAFLARCASDKDLPRCIVVLDRSNAAIDIESMKTYMGKQTATIMRANTPKSKRAEKVSLRGVGFVFADASVPTDECGCGAMGINEYNDRVLGRIRHFSGRIQHKTRICASPTVDLLR